jgi:hypothetical protein
LIALLISNTATADFPLDTRIPQKNTTCCPQRKGRSKKKELAPKITMTEGGLGNMEPIWLKLT